MLKTVTRIIRKFRYGEPVYVVSGLPRSGTSMLMNMLAAGGLDVLTDAQRVADEDNPLGYFEHERIKDLENENDKTWLRQARGKAVKVISHLLKELPDDNFYYVIFARRDLREVVASQNIMLERRGEENPIEDERAIDHYKKHLVNIRVLARRRPNIELLELHYSKSVERPVDTADRICQFIDRSLDTERMAAVIDRKLHRNRVT